MSNTGISDLDGFFGEIDLSYDYWAPEVGDSIKCIPLLRDDSVEPSIYLCSLPDNTAMFRLPADKMPDGFETYLGWTMEVVALALNHYVVRECTDGDT